MNSWERPTVVRLHRLRSGISSEWKGTTDRGNNVLIRYHRGTLIAQISWDPHGDPRLSNPLYSEDLTDDPKPLTEKDMIGHLVPVMQFNV